MRHPAAKTVSLAGSERPRPAGSRLLGALDPNARVGITLVIRAKPGSPPLPDLEYWQRTPPHKRRFLTPAEYATTYGAAQDDLDTVASVLASYGVSVLERHGGRRCVTAQGTAAQMLAAFGVTLNRYETPRPAMPRRAARSAHGGAHAPTPRQPTCIHHGHDGAVRLPTTLDGIITAVIGLDNREISAPTGTGDPNGAAPMGVPAVAQLYNFPNSGAADQTIGIIAPQGSQYVSCYDPQDITQYFQGLPAAYQTPPGLKEVDLTVFTTPYANNLTLISQVPSNSTQYTDDTYAYALEVTQDISTSATIAQGATVNVYFTEDSEQGWLVFLNRVLQPGQEKQPTVVSCSFAMDDTDAGPTPAARTISTLLQQIATLGITVCVGAGDQGTNSGASDTKPHVMYPASDPFVTSVGATMLGDFQSGPPATHDEWVWSDAHSNSFYGSAKTFGATGGGASETFPVPPYQTAAGITQITDSKGQTHTGRFVPDVAGMVAYNGFVINRHGFEYWGTSCVAPLYAGLVAVLQQALGAPLGFLNPTLYQLAATAFNDVTFGNNDPGNGAAYYTAAAGWDACSGLGSIDGTKLLNGIASIMYPPGFYFVLDKTTYGLDEVRVAASYQNAFWLVLEGYSPNMVGTAKPQTPSGMPAGMTVVVGAAQPEAPLLPDTPQRILFPCQVNFAAAAIQPTPQGIFPDPGSGAIPVTISTSIMFSGLTYVPPSVTLALTAGEDPYFFNINPAANNVFYLSNDLRVFTVTPGAQQQPIATENGVPTPPPLTPATDTAYDTGAGYGYIEALLGFLNAHYSDPAGTDPFTLLPDQSSALYGVSSIAATSINPSNPNGERLSNYMFGIARVRLTGAANTTTPSNVRVLFRLFATETSDTDFTPDMYPSTTDAAGTPLSPTVGTGGVTLPVFATGNYEANADYGVNNDYPATGTTVNDAPIAIGASGSVWAYYGCYLNVFPTNNTITSIGSFQTGLPGTHHCLVAQIAFADSPIEGSGGVNASPDNSDKLAQRNLNITFSDNPGPASTHRVPQTFDIRPSKAVQVRAGTLSYPDELMIQWGNTPVGSKASIYWPQVRATEVLALAREMYSTHQLSALDANTIGCTVPNGVTWVPIPPGAGENFAGLFTVDLPQTVVTGQDFTITVRRVTTGRITDVISSFAGSGATGAGTLASWRNIVGTFGVRIPVTTATTMMPVDEDTLAIMKWRVAHMPRSSRWVPVMQRYISYIEARINGLGGDASTIVASPYGVEPGNRLPSRGGEHVYTGKVNGVVYDRFGDFEGFLLLTKRGHERAFKSRERRIEELVRYAWIERVLITVFAEGRDGERPVSIVLRRGPRE